MTILYVYGRGHDNGDLDEGDMYVELSTDQIADVLLDLGANRTRPQGENVQSDHCFLHKNEDPTLGVSVDAPHSWNCFNPLCKKGITIFSLIKHARGATLKQAREWLYQRFPDLRSSERPFKALSDASTEPLRRHFTLPHTVLAAYPLNADGDLGYRAVDYYGVCSREQADEFHLGYDRRYHRLIVPVYHKNGDLGGLTGRHMQKNFHGNRWYNYDPGEFLTGYVIAGSEQPLVPGPVVVVEGPGDYLNLRAMGIPNVRSVLGAEFTDWQLEELVALDRPIVPMFDHDKAGFKAKRKFIDSVNRRVEIWGYEYPTAAFGEDGKADPGSIPHDEADFLLSTFSQASKMKRLH